MDEFYIVNITPPQRAHLKERGFRITDWGDGSINVAIPLEKVDDFDSWCEGQDPPLVPELK
jgi:hypothetical protein